MWRHVLHNQVTPKQLHRTVATPIENKFRPIMQKIYCIRKSENHDSWIYNDTRPTCATLGTTIVASHRAQHIYYSIYKTLYIYIYSYIWLLIHCVETLLWVATQYPCRVCGIFLCMEAQKPARNCPSWNLFAFGIVIDQGSNYYMLHWFCQQTDVSWSMTHPCSDKNKMLRALA